MILPQAEERNPAVQIRPLSYHLRHNNKPKGTFSPAKYKHRPGAVEHEYDTCVHSIAAQ